MLLRRIQFKAESEITLFQLNFFKKINKALLHKDQHSTINKLTETGNKDASGLIGTSYDIPASENMFMLACVALKEFRNVTAISGNSLRAMPGGIYIFSHLR